MVGDDEGYYRLHGSESVIITQMHSRFVFPGIMNLKLSHAPFYPVNSYEIV